MVYVDNGIFVGNDDTQLQNIIKEVQDLGLNIEDEGNGRILTQGKPLMHA